nr:hypothetical protein HUO10_005084 [Paraburkholderia busanensis]
MKMPASVIARGVSFALTALLAVSAHAGQPGTELQSAAAFPAVPAASAAADKVYPPLPSLAMLPPPGANDEDAPSPKPATHRRKTRTPVQTVERRMPMAPVAKLVVSDASHAYLDGVQRQIDLAMSK